MTFSIPPIEEWLSLSRAAKCIGVHPTTLRRWADTGEIPTVVTPGGHRRFLNSDIERFSDERRRLKLVLGLERLWAEQALVQARRDISLPENLPWLASFDRQQREDTRLVGRRLMGIILQYISLADGGEDLLQEARAIGREYAGSALTLKIPLTDAMQAALFFRDTLVEVAVQLPEVARVRPEANARLLRRINSVLNAVQLAIAGEYEPGRPPGDGTRA